MTDKSDSGQHTATAERTKTKKPPLYAVLLINDDYTPMDFVVEILIGIFEKTKNQATDIMLKVHHEGRGLCGTFPLEIAETKVSGVRDEARKAGHPLQCIYERE